MVDSDNVFRAARNYLATSAPLKALLGRDDFWDTWIFPQKLHAFMENTQSVSVVVAPAGTWTVPNEHNSMEFPRLLVNIWADPTRNADNSVQVEDGEDKIYRVKKELDKMLHFANRSPQGQLWDGFRVLSSRRLGEVEFPYVSDGNGLVLGVIYYGVTVG